MPHLDPQAVDYLTERVEIDHETGCWNWTLSVGSHGYGNACWDRKAATSHRLSYSTLVGEIPEGLHIDHLCHNRRCVNPDHLEAVTQAENNRRSGFRRRVVQCKHGHGEDNYYRLKNGKPECRVCRKAFDALYRERKRDRKAA